MIANVSSLALRVEAKRADLEADVLAALPDSVYQALPLAEETVAGCIRAVSTAIKTKNPRAIRRWLAYESQAPHVDHLLATLTATIDQVALTAQSVGVGESVQAMRYLDWIRADAHHFVNDRPTAIAPAVRSDLTALVDGLVRMVAAHDAATGEHLDAVGELAERFARRVAAVRGLEPDFATRCRIAGRLHDIGKIAVDARLLTKPAALTELEAQLVGTAASRGAEIVSGIPALAEYAPIVRAVPQLADAPLESRVVAIADAFHAMTVPHPFRRPRAVALAIDELRRAGGTQYDPALVELFVETLQAPGVAPLQASA